MGTQLGLSDGLNLPPLVAQYGSGFLLLYVLLKFVLILPILQAELVAGRMYRVTPFEFSFLILNRTWARFAFAFLLIGIIFLLALNLFNTAWTMVFGFDGLRGELLGLRPLDQTLYWFEQSQNSQRILVFILAQGILLMLLGGLSWQGIGLIFSVTIPIFTLAMLAGIPAAAAAIYSLGWQPLAFEGALVAIQHAITSSMVGLLVWYVLGTKVSDRLPTGRIVLGVQGFDVVFGLSLLGLAWPWLLASGVDQEVGGVLRALMSYLSTADRMPWEANLFLASLCLIGVLSSLPLLLLVAQETNVRLRQWLLAVTVTGVVILASVLIFSHGSASPLVWYGQPIYTILLSVSQGAIVPAITAVLAIWVGWVVWPNRVLMQINPRGAIRYFLWRLALKFVVPLALAVVFARTAWQMIASNAVQAGLVVAALLLLTRLYHWVKKRAVFPSL